jgi:predicted RNase H-like nuclease
LKFIGIDLAWSYKNNTAISVLELHTDKRSVNLIDYAERLNNDGEIIDYVSRNINKGTFISIDAPLIVKNITGARPVDKEISARFRKSFAGTHPCNLNKFKGKVRGHELVKKLSSLGLRQNPYINISRRRQITNIIIEVYPHPAQVVLFKLRKRILYKRGDVETKRKGLLRLRKYIMQRLTTIEPRLNKNSNLTDLCTRNMRSMRGKSLKRYEDTLDSLICAYVGLYNWYWGSEKSEVIGNLQTGYIVNPKMC